MKKIEGFLCIGTEAICLTKTLYGGKYCDSCPCPLEYTAQSIEDWLWEFRNKKVCLTVEERRE
ncbi:MAG: hypothetical protein DDT19_00074 [Syntrophomonadaceae bacterium]|nr:hypothetical protein [Bacillota bacterium]